MQQPPPQLRGLLIQGICSRRRDSRHAAGIACMRNSMHAARPPMLYLTHAIPAACMLSLGFYYAITNRAFNIYSTTHILKAL
jgi:hypothetical protein